VSATDPYCYPGSSVLINKFGIRDKARLEHVEREFVPDVAAIDPRRWIDACRDAHEGNYDALAREIGRAPKRPRDVQRASPSRMNSRSQ
jgi:hypothetical protein